MPVLDPRQKLPPFTPVNWAVPRAAGLIAAWEFSEGGGSTIHDMTGLYGNGTINNGSGGMWEAGEQGLDVPLATASSQFIQVPNNPRLQLNTAFTTEVLVYQNSNRNYNGLMTKTSSNIGAPFDQYIATGTLNCFYGSTGGTVSLTVSGLAAAVWLHIIFTADAPASAGGNTQNFRIYINGVLRASSVTTQAIADNGNNIRIGTRNDGATNIDGKFARARLWNRALTPREVFEEYTDPLGIFYRQKVWAIPKLSVPEQWPGYYVDAEMPQLQPQ